MAQHLLVAADRFELERLRRICERRLCETVDVETVATTLTLAEQNNAEVSDAAPVPLCIALTPTPRPAACAVPADPCAMMLIEI